MITNIPAWQYYIKYYQDAYRLLFLSIIVSIGQSLLVVPLALLVGYAIDEVIPARDFYLLALIGGVLFLLHILNTSAALWTRYITLKATHSAISRFRNALLEKCYTVSRSYYTEADQKKWHTSIVLDTERLNNISSDFVSRVLPAIFISVVLCVVLLFLNWFLFLVMISIAPLLILTNRLMAKVVQARVQVFQRSFESFSKGALFVLQMMDLTRIQTAEHSEMAKQREQLEELRQTGISMAWIYALYGSAQTTTMTAIKVIILIVGGIAVAAEFMTLGALLSFYVAVGLLNNYINTILSAIPNLITGNESLTTLFNLLQIKDTSPYSGHRQISFKGKITFESVSFQYRDEPILHDLNLTIHPHTTVGIRGPNGVGKSTIIQLILGFYHPQKGQLYADDQPFSELDIVLMRRALGVVMQDTMIFPGTIFENMTYGCPTVSRQQVIHAAELATAHDFIQQLPQGYDTPVGERGVLLSGGQRQRIAIARALLRQPKCLILDEPTNHLDVAVIKQLMSNLKQLETHPTTLLISHDMNIVQQAEYVYVLQDGHLVTNQNDKRRYYETVN